MENSVIKYVRSDRFPTPALHYKECDDKVMADTLKNMGLNITPPWLTDNLDDVTVTPVQSCEMSQIWT